MTCAGMGRCGGSSSLRPLVLIGLLPVASYALAAAAGAKATPPRPPLLSRLHDNGLLELRLNRPEKLNALDGPLVQLLEQQFARARRDEQILGVMLTGSGRAFCAGGDIAKVHSYAQDSVAKAEAFLELECALASCLCSCPPLSSPLRTNLDDACTPAASVLLLRRRAARSPSLETCKHSYVVRMQSQPSDFPGAGMAQCSRFTPCPSSSQSSFLSTAL